MVAAQSSGRAAIIQFVGGAFAAVAGLRAKVTRSGEGNEGGSGSACRSNSDCGANFVCVGGIFRPSGNCGSNADCPSNHVGDDGTCSPSGNCTVNGDRATGFNGVSGTWRPISGRANVDNLRLRGFVCTGDTCRLATNCGANADAPPT